MNIWPRSFLDPNSDRWRLAVESKIDANGSFVQGILENLRGLSAGITGLRERVAAQHGNLQSGVAVLPGDGTNGINADVTFPRPFLSPPAVVVSSAGYRVGYEDTVSGNAYTGADAWSHLTTLNVTTEGFSLVALASSGVYDTANSYYFNWMARSVG